MNIIFGVTLLEAWNILSFSQEATEVVSVAQHALPSGTRF